MHFNEFNRTTLLQIIIKSLKMHFIFLSIFLSKLSYLFPGKYFYSQIFPKIFYPHDIFGHKKNKIALILYNLLY